MADRVDWDQDAFEITNTERWVIREVMHAGEGDFGERRDYLLHKAAKNGLTEERTAWLLELFEFDKGQA